MIDFHSHLLPGIDDGSHDMAETERQRRHWNRALFRNMNVQVPQ